MVSTTELAEGDTLYFVVPRFPACSESSQLNAKHSTWKNETIVSYLQQNQAKINAALTQVGTIHFARFLMIPGTQYLFVITAYDGDFDAYIQAFTNILGDVFNLLFSCVDPAPPLPVQQNVAAFQAFVSKYNLPTGLYSAYPNCTVVQIWRNGVGPSGMQTTVAACKGGGPGAWLLVECEVVRTMFPQQVPEALDAVIAESPKAAKRARRAAERLFAEGVAGVTKTCGSGYLESGNSTIKRWRYQLGYLAPTTEDYRWAERHGINHGLMPVLRPFRLLRKYGPFRAWRIIFPSRI